MNRGSPGRNRGIRLKTPLSRAESCGERSALRQQRVDRLLELFDWNAAFDHLAVDEERRRRLDFVFLAGAFAHREDVVVELLVLQAFVECFFRKACLLAYLLQRRDWITHRPL